MKWLAIMHDYFKSNNTYAIGVALTIVAAIAASSGGLMIRYINTEDTWAILFYRSLAFTIIVFIFKKSSLSPDAKAHSNINSRWRFLAALSLSLAFVTYIFAMQYTSVGIVLIIMCTAPFIVCILQYLIYRKSTSHINILMMMISFLAISLVASRHIGHATLPGAIFAFLSASLYSIFIVLIGNSKNIQPVNTVLIAGFIATIISFVFAESLVVHWHDILVSTCLGIFQIGTQYILIAVASRMIKADQISLIMLLEVVLGPLLVWLIHSENLDIAVIYALPIVVSCVAFSTLYGGRSRHLNSNQQFLLRSKTNE